MDTIKDIWFDANRIYMKTDGGETFSRPLEAFPLLKDASDRERLDFKIGKFGDDVRWESLDEDIHISSFFDTAEPDYENEIAMIFKRFPQLNVSEVARSMGINKSLLSKYIYGIKKPSDIRKNKQIRLCCCVTFLHPSGRCGEQAKLIPRTGQAYDAGRVGVYRVPGSLVCCILYILPSGR